MTRLLLSVLLLLAPLSLAAQHLFDLEVANCGRLLRCPNASYVQQRMAHFQQQALAYLAAQAVDSVSARRHHLLDEQAYHLSDFMRLFYQVRSDSTLSESQQDLWVQRFSEASVESPLFYDDDNPRVLEFIARQTFTPFSLDTDWEKAFHRIFQQLGQSPETRAIAEGFQHAEGR